MIESFEQYIRALLLRNNTITGTPITEDPTILAWESGNELKPPANWTKRIASFVKSIDPNHLFLDGTYGINTQALPFEEVDIYSDHYYPMDSNKLRNDFDLVNKSNKVFFAGEFGWTYGDLTSFLQTLNSLGAYNCYWSLLFYFFIENIFLLNLLKGVYSLMEIGTDTFSIMMVSHCTGQEETKQKEKSLLN